MLVDKRCKKGSDNDKVGCDLGYRSHKNRTKTKKQVKCKGSMNFKNSEYKLNCKPDKTENISCKFSTSLDFTPKGKKHLTNRRYKKKRMAYLNCVQTSKSTKKSKSKSKSNSKSNPKQKELNKQYELLLNGLYDYFKDKDKNLERFLKGQKQRWTKSKKATEASIKALLIKTEYKYIPKGFQNILEGGKYKLR
tara:strand:- start:387 stop:965 length:579 start_codon:yes stop_codon:yes gene_type:complete